jgi:hypothetical protein
MGCEKPNKPVILGAVHLRIISYVSFNCSGVATWKGPKTYGTKQNVREVG